VGTFDGFGRFGDTEKFLGQIGHLGRPKCLTNPGVRFPLVPEKETLLQALFRLGFGRRDWLQSLGVITTDANLPGATLTED
jgi:hypothetical protein